MPALFEDKKLTARRPKNPCKGEYEFYDSSARPEYDTCRAQWNEWLAEMPESIATWTPVTEHDDYAQACRTVPDRHPHATHELENSLCFQHDM